MCYISAGQVWLLNVYLAVLLLHHLCRDVLLSVPLLVHQLQTRAAVRVEEVQGGTLRNSNEDKRAGERQ